MVCPKCGSTSVTANTSTYVVSKSRSFIWNLLLVFLTGGFWLHWLLFFVFPLQYNFSSTIVQQ